MAHQTEELYEVIKFCVSLRPNLPLRWPPHVTWNMLWRRFKVCRQNTVGKFRDVLENVWLFCIRPLFEISNWDIESEPMRIGAFIRLWEIVMGIIQLHKMMKGAYSGTRFWRLGTSVKFFFFFCCLWFHWEDLFWLIMNPLWHLKENLGSVRRVQFLVSSWILRRVACLYIRNILDQKDKSKGRDHKTCSMALLSFFSASTGHKWKFSYMVYQQATCVPALY